MWEKKKKKSHLTNLHIPLGCAGVPVSPSPGTGIGAPAAGSDRHAPTQQLGDTGTAPPPKTYF